MRGLLDTNVLISALLPAKDPPGAVARIVDAVFAGEFTLLLPEQVIQELRRTIAAKRYFTERITAEEVTIFVDELRMVATVLADLGEPTPVVVRDPDDDFILAHAIFGKADYLVTGDKDLLALGDAVAPLIILSPADFVTAVLDQRRR
jgi:putative PIN family toxin of toxin-antitoxin system